MKSTRKFVCAMAMAFGLMAGFSSMSARALDKAPAAPAAKIDLNKATEEELQELPAVGDATAKKIIAGRPYKTVDDLVKHGIRASTIDKIAPMVIQPRDAAAAAAAPKKEDPKATTKMDPKAATTDKKDEKVDINTADAADLEELPGVGDATAKKIIAGRPYKTHADLLKAGVTQKTIDKISPMITIGSATAAKPTKEDPKATSKEVKKDETPAKVPPKKGMVWVNTETKVFHEEGDRWYGKTKKGEFMTEEDAIKAGARKAK